MKIETANVIKRYNEYIALLEEENKLLAQLVAEGEKDKKTELSKKHRLKVIAWRKRFWEIEGEITAKRQYVAAYKQRADQETLKN